MNSKGLYLRIATIEDLKLVQFWDTQEHVINSDPDDEWNWEVELNRIPIWREQLIAELNKRPIGFVQIIDPAKEETHYWGNCAPNLRAIDIWIGNASDLGKGYGTTMMNQALAKCFINPKVEGVLLDPLASNKRAHVFYERLGLKFQEKKEFEGEPCFVYYLTKEDWMKNKIEIEAIAQQSHEVFDGEPWFGDSVCKKLLSIPFAHVHLSLPGQSKSIAQLVGHILNWKRFVIANLQGDQDYFIEMNSDIDWPKTSHENQQSWENQLKELKESQKTLLELILSKDDEFLMQKVSGHKRQYTYEMLLNGIVHHDIYHLGQIALISSFHSSAPES